MGIFFLFFLVVLIALGAASGESFVFTILYLIVGVVVIGRWWSSQALSKIVYKRIFNQRVFPQEEVQVRIVIENKGLLPVLWLQVRDLLPVEISPQQAVQEVVSLTPRAHVQIEYTLLARKRGYYQVGPLKFTTGDLLGIGQDDRQEHKSQYLTIYPKVVPLHELGLPSHSPLGSLRYKEPIYEDPNRQAGKRDYVSGDSLRRIDWKSSASVGRLQVKQFEPSIALETAVFLNLNTDEYFYRRRFDATELAIVTAASIASWVVSKKQSVGLVTNGLDPFAVDGTAQVLPPHKGRAHLMRLLENLARLKTSQGLPLTHLLHQQRPHLSWGTTVVVITGQVDDDLFDEFFQAQRAGLDIVVILCGELMDLKEIKRRAKRFGIPVYHIWTEQDLEIWQK
jgi:uncharacterized protein (DUF58 family)